MNTFYKNKNVLITGAAGGLGSELVRQLYELDANIFCILNKKSDDHKIKQISDKSGGSNTIKIYRCDLSCREEISLITQEDFLNKIDVLINCAGTWSLQDIQDVTLEEYDKTMSVNGTAPFILSRKCAESMKNRDGGLIINIGSSSCYNGCPDSGAYSISKHALLGMSRSLSKSFKKYNIKSLIYCPGSIQTNMGSRDTRQNFETFLNPSKVAAYIVHASSLSNDMIIDESRINRISIH